MMALLPNDKEFLDSHGYNYEVHEMPGLTLLVINDYMLAPMFNQEKTKVLIQIPAGYPLGQLDMFWVNPYITLKATGSYPSCADYFGNSFLGESWQRFSRHYAWKQGYNLSTHLNVIKETLVNGRE
jgi:hypothetical protein